MSENDQRILELKAQIATKKKELGEAERFNPITHCSLDLDGIRYNLHVTNKETLTFIMVKLNSYRLSAEDLKLDSLMIGDFSVAEWIADVNAKLANMNIKEESRRLKTLESQLERLLSEEKKTELAIDEIASSL